MAEWAFSHFSRYDEVAVQGSAKPGRTGLAGEWFGVKLLRKLEFFVLALALLIIVGTAGFHHIEGWSWFDSFYMVAITLTTIGYAEVHPLSLDGRIFNLLLIGTGLVLVALSFGALTQTLLEFELGKFFGRRRMEREIHHLEGHYIICGAGRVGRSAARELAANGVPLVLIESHEQRLAGIEYLSIVGDATRETVLREARIDKALGLVAATTTDAVNVYIVLNARGLNPKLRIIARASEEDAEKHLLTAGADTVISPQRFAGHRVAQAFLRPNVLDFLDMATSRDGQLELRLEEVRISAKSPLAGKTIESSHVRQSMGLVVLAIRRGAGDMQFNPGPHEVIQPEDCLIVMGEPDKLQALGRLKMS